MDSGARRKHWDDNMFTPLSSPAESLEELPTCSAVKKQPEKTKKNEGNLLPNRKCQDEINLKTKDLFNQNIKEPNVRDYKMNILNNGAGPSSMAPGSPQPQNIPGSPQAQVKLGSTESQVNLFDLESIEAQDMWNFNNLLRARIRARSTYKIEGISALPKFSKGSATKVPLSVLNQELEELRLKCREIETDFETTEKELVTSRQVPDEEFEDIPVFEPEKKDIRIEILKNDLSEKALTIKNLTCELQHSEELIEKLNLENRRLKETIRKLKHQHYIGNTLLKEELQFHYKMEMKKVYAELETLKADLETEKAIQARNKRALELLKKYFETKNSFGIFDSLPEEDSS